jgi:hypothetical protein
MPVDSRHRHGSVFPRHSRFHRTRASPGSSDHRRRLHLPDSTRHCRRDLRCSSHQRGSADHAGSRCCRRSEHPGNTSRRDTSTRAHSTPRCRRMPLGSMTRQCRQTLGRSRSCRRLPHPGSNHPACTSLTRRSTSLRRRGALRSTRCRCTSRSSRSMSHCSDCSTRSNGHPGRHHRLHSRCRHTPDLYHNTIRDDRLALHGNSDPRRPTRQGSSYPQGMCVGQDSTRCRKPVVPDNSPRR